MTVEPRCVTASLHDLFGAKPVNQNDYDLGLSGQAKWILIPEHGLEP